MKRILVTLGLLATSSTAFAQQAKPPTQAQQQAGGATVQQRQEPTAQIPTDPLAMSPEMRAQIGSDYEAHNAPAEGRIKRQYYGLYYQERRGDYRLRMIPPLWFEHTRGLLDPGHPELGQSPDREGLYGLFYYQRRSLKKSADILFPFFWHLRDDKEYLTIAGPFVHQETPTGHDNWLAP
ncbi:MAG TPA: hypothetical protein VH054_08820, partial [Polyangiaceae bacterium]|nr:hypothetical protein [Polyangiaceae bacterium]